MKPGSTPRTAEDHAWADATDLTRTEIRRLTRRITAAVYAELHKEFDAAAKRGQVIAVRPDAESIKAHVRQAVAAEFDLKLPQEKKARELPV